MTHAQEIRLEFKNHLEATNDFFELHGSGKELKLNAKFLLEELNKLDITLKRLIEETLYKDR